MAIAIYNIMIELVRAQVALESGSFEVPSPSAPGRTETVRTWTGSIRFGVGSGRLSWPRSSFPTGSLVPIAALQTSYELNCPATSIDPLITLCLPEKAPKHGLLGLWLDKFCRPKTYPEVG